MMPGIAALLTYGNSSTDPSLAVDTLVAGMYGSPSAEVIEAADAENLAIRHVCPAGFPGGWTQTQDAIVVWHGIPHYQGKAFCQKVAEELARSQRIGRPQSWARDMTGHFQILVYVRATKSLYLINDRVSAMPFYWAALSNGIALVPEPLAFRTLIASKWSPSIREGALFEFLASGHLFGDGTFWNEVRRLGPGQILEAVDGRITVTAYWDFRIECASHSETQQCERLRAAIEEDIRLMPEGDGVLMLSGGYDSRALLGLLRQHGSRYTTISYALGDEYEKDSDAESAGYFARKAGVPHTIYEATLEDVDWVIGSFEQAVSVNGAESDTSPAVYSMLGEPFFAQLARDHDYVIRGDEVWGWGDSVLTRDMAFWQTLLLRLDHIPQAGRMLTSDAFQKGNEYLRDQRRRMILEYTARQSSANYSTSPNNLKDYLYWRHREARLIQDMACYCRHFLPHYAPFIFGNAIDIVRTLPQSLRCRKRLFMKTMESMYPELFRDSKQPTKQTPKISRFQRIFERPEFQAYARDHLIDRPPSALGALLDGEAVRTWLELAMSPQPSTPRQHRVYDVRRQVYDLLRRNKTVLSVTMATCEAMGKAALPVLDENYLYRMLTLARGLEYYESSPPRASRT